MTLPGGEGPFPAALLISGAGPQDRDYAVFGHRPFLVLADHITRRGVAVLRLDDRGAGGSGGDAAQASVADIVGDLRAGVQWLVSSPLVDASSVGLIAHSEGGRVAPVAASEINAVAFVILLAPPAVSARELAEGQAVATSAVSDDPLLQVQADLVARIREVLGREVDADRAVATIFDRWDEWAQTLPPDRAQILDIIRAQEAFPTQLEQLVSALGTPWNRELFELDPTPPLRSLGQPALALYGSRDRQAPPIQSVPVLEALWADHPDAAIQILPELNHFFQHAETGLPAEIPQLDESFAPEAMDLVSDWLAARFGALGSP